MAKVLPSDERYPSTKGYGANSTVAGEGKIVKDKAKADHLDSDNRSPKKNHLEASGTNFGEGYSRRQETMRNSKFDPNPSKEGILHEEEMLASRGVSKDSGKRGPHSSKPFELIEHDGSTTLKHEKRLSSNHGSIDQGSEQSFRSMELHADDKELSVAASSTLSQRSGTHRLTRPSLRKYARESKRLLGDAEQNSLEVPGAIFMEHPAESKASELLKRHNRRVEDVRDKQGKVEELMKLVMDHDPGINECPLPDIDKVFPMNRSSDKLQNDFRV